jgi:hypothetical protein
MTVDDGPLVRASFDYIGDREDGLTDPTKNCIEFGVVVGNTSEDRVRLPSRIFASVKQ